MLTTVNLEKEKNPLTDRAISDAIFTVVRTAASGKWGRRDNPL